MTETLRSVASTRLFRFVVVGVGAAALLFLLAYLFVVAGMPPFPASVLAYALAFVAAYTAQHGWTFGGRHAHGSALPRYFIVQVCCALLSGVVSHISVSRFGASPVVMSAATTIAASATSFVLATLWVFPERSS